MDRDILGLSEDVWILTEKCWDQAPSTRPHIVEILFFLETAADNWVSPTSEEVAGLAFSPPTSQNSSTPESTDTMESATTPGPIGGDI